jgi:hypothetical protein
MEGVYLCFRHSNACSTYYSVGGVQIYGHRAKFCTALDPECLPTSQILVLLHLAYALIACYYFMLSDTREKLSFDLFSTIYRHSINVITRL